MAVEKYESPIPSPTKYALSCFGKVLAVNVLVVVFLVSTQTHLSYLIGGVIGLGGMIYFIFEEIQNYLRDSLYNLNGELNTDLIEATTQ